MLPFGPLDLAVSNARDHHEANILRNMYLGIAGGACGIDSSKLANSFHCGPACVAWRRGDVVQKLPRIREIVKKFAGVKRVRVLSQWGNYPPTRLCAASTWPRAACLTPDASTPMMPRW